MGAFEFDLSARNCCNNNNNGAGETCIIAQKIFDQCRIQKCLTADILGPARAARSNGNTVVEIAGDESLIGTFKEVKINKISSVLEAEVID